MDKIYSFAYAEDAAEEYIKYKNFREFLVGKKEEFLKFLESYNGDDPIIGQTYPYVARNKALVLIHITESNIVEVSLVDKDREYGMYKSYIGGRIKRYIKAKTQQL